MICNVTYINWWICLVRFSFNLLVKLKKALNIADRFTIVSYNILGVENASKHLDLYDRIDPQHLSWDTRKKRIHKELTCYNPSILCFQVSEALPDNFFFVEQIYVHFNIHAHACT